MRAQEVKKNTKKRKQGLSGGLKNTYDNKTPSVEKERKGERVGEEGGWKNGRFNKKLTGPFKKQSAWTPLRVGN